MRRLFITVLAVASCITVVDTSLAELQPSQVAIVANAASKNSRAIASYYAGKRGIPKSQICLIEAPVNAGLSRNDWETKVRPTIRNWLKTKKLQAKIKCFVTTWDVPLKIGKQEALDTATKRREFMLARERKRRIVRLNEFLAELDEIAGLDHKALAQDAKPEDIKASFEATLKAAQEKIPGMSELERGPAQSKLQQYSIGTAGLNFMVQNLQASLQTQANANVKSNFDFGRGRLFGIGEANSVIDGLAPSIERDSVVLTLVERASGILGSVAWIDGQTNLLDKNETESSFDSELSLVLWGDYPLIRWQQNYLHFRFDGSPLRELNRTLMVTRLEAPTIKLTQSLIDTALRVEKEGLKGKVYLDARGIAKLDATNLQAGSPGDYDRSVLMAAKLFKENTNLEVVLNDQNTLFAEGECPDAALYCGWYSLAKYVDSFEWKPGAIGYHMASSEAGTLRNKDSQVWCKRMLEDMKDPKQGGVCGTLGPVHEPYLMSFPRPNEFFAVLGTGKFTYAEAVYRTKSFNSWMMTVVGDPLYNPFKTNPALKEVPAGYELLLNVK